MKILLCENIHHGGLSRPPRLHFGDSQNWDMAQVNYCVVFLLYYCWSVVNWYKEGLIMNQEHHNMNTGGGQAPGNTGVCSDSLCCRLHFYQCQCLRCSYCCNIFSRNPNVVKHHSSRLPWLQRHPPLTFEWTLQLWMWHCQVWLSTGYLRIYFLAQYLKFLCMDFPREPL